MIKFNQLKEVLLQDEMEILEDEYIDELNRQQFEFNSDMLYRQFHVYPPNTYHMRVLV